MDAILEVRNLTKRFHGLLAIDHISFMLERNEILGLIGPNGAGKTTMISLVSGTLEPTEGEVLFEGAPIRQLPAYRRGRLGIARRGHDHGCSHRPSIHVRRHDRRRGVLGGDAADHCADAHGQGRAGRDGDQALGIHVRSATRRIRGVSVLAVIPS